MQSNEGMRSVMEHTEILYRHVAKNIGTQKEWRLKSLNLVAHSCYQNWLN
jgi:hypothetical protein